VLPALLALVAIPMVATPVAARVQSTPPAGEPLNIGIIAPFTGPFSVVADDLVDGWEMYWEERGSTEVAGREIVWHTADDANDPATGVTQANALVSQENVEVIVGPVTTAVGAPVAEEMNRQGIPVLTPVLSDDNVTQRSPIEGLVRVAGWTASQVTHAFGDWAYDQGYRRIATICFDLQFGYEHCGGFSQVFKDRGGEIIEQLWHGIGEEDFAGLIAQLRAADPDAVFVGNSGPDAVRFVQTWSDFGLKDEIPLLATETTLDQTSLRSLDADVAEGLISVGHWAEGRDAPVTSEFTSTFLERYGRLPSYFAPAMYAAAQWLESAIAALDGDTSDRAAFVEAIRAVQLDETPLGPMVLDEYDSPIENIYIRQVEVREDGLLWNVVIDTYENVSQFWTYDPEEYLATPAYSQDYQG
jgi:branched-chain amino acid transport system substrate-binding protein